MKKIFIIILNLFFITNAMANIKSYFLTAKNIDENCQIRVLESIPQNNIIKSDFFFFIGYGDRADNHLPLFKKLTDSGMRVISFDYPSHGLSKCNHLNTTDYSQLMDLVVTIEAITRPKINRPIILSGWSTGGLLALRLAQSNILSGRNIKSLILIAPGLSVYPLVGGDGIIRNETLLNNPNPPHMAEPKPISPLLSPFFSSSIIVNGILARNIGMPYIPTLFFIADDNQDMYAKSKVLKSFALKQKELYSELKIIQCTHSKHEMDNEISPIGELVRNEISLFANNPENKILTNDQCLELN